VFVAERQAISPFGHMGMGLSSQAQRGHDGLYSRLMGGGEGDGCPTTKSSRMVRSHVTRTTMMKRRPLNLKLKRQDDSRLGKGGRPVTRGQTLSRPGCARINGGQI
jgi:hypothetical protein